MAGKEYSFQQHNDFIRKYQEGTTRKELARQLGVTVSAVNNRLVRLGVPTEKRPFQKPKEPTLKRFLQCYEELRRFMGALKASALTYYQFQWAYKKLPRFRKAFTEHYNVIQSTYRCTLCEKVFPEEDIPKHARKENTRTGQCRVCLAERRTMILPREMKAQWEKQGGLCAYTGRPMNGGKDAAAWDGDVLCRKVVREMKGKLGKEEFVELCREVVVGSAADGQTT